MAQEWRHITTCSAFNRSAMIDANHAAKALARHLGQRYGAASVNSDIDECGALARYKVAVPWRALAPVYAALKRRRPRRG